MKKFNNNDMFTGYLKQLLHDFNLPKIKVYTKKHQEYFKKYNIESPEILTTQVADKTPSSIDSSIVVTKNIRYFPYLKDGEIQEYINNNWQNIGQKLKSFPKTYTYGDKILNYTKNLVVDNNIYDSYTHEYLGDYLRFQRDYTGINLMPLYNCFSNRSCDKLSYQWNLGSKEDDDSIQKVEFKTSDQNYKIYMLPIKLFETYTIAIDSSTPVELCCGIYGDYQDTRDKFINIPRLTYKKIGQCTFSNPFIYDALTYNQDDKINTLLESLSEPDLIELAQNECDLKLFIKIPKDNVSTIVILEGDYRSWNNYIWRFGETKKTNKTIINIDKDLSNLDIPLITNLQLLKFNTKEQHPFADRLIEYLTGNAITSADDEIYDNIRRAQKALWLNTNTNNFRPNIWGLWSTNMNKLFYEYINSNQDKYDVNHDILGYVDKDVEKYYQALINRTTGETTSLSNIELEEGEK